MGEGSPYVESNAAMSGENIKNSPGVEEAFDYYPKNILNADTWVPHNLEEQINLFKTEIARVKEGDRFQRQEFHSIGYDDYLAKLEKGLEISLSGLNKPTTNPGVYQYPSLVEGGPLEKSVKAKDGTILRSIVEAYANKLPKGLVNEKNAILEALVDLQKEFPGKTVPYEALKSYVSLGIQPARVMTTNEKAYYGLDKIGYGEYPSTHLGGSQIAVKARTNVYQDDKFGIAPNDSAHPKNASYWIRSFVSGESDEIYNVIEWQSRLKELQNPNAPVLTNIVSDALIKEAYELVPNYFLPTTYPLGDGYSVGKTLAVLDHEILLDSQHHNSVSKVIKFHEDLLRKSKEIRPPNLAANKQIVWHERELARWKIEFPKTEEYALIQLRKEVANANRPPKAEVNKNLALYKDMNLKWIHESMLDAARGSQTILRVPTAETSFKIQYHNSDTKNSEAIHAKYKDFPKFAKKELGLDVKAVTDELGNSWWEVVIPKKYFNTDPSNISEFKTYKKGGILQSMTKKYYKEGRNTALRSLVKKYGAGGGVADFGAQGNFTSEYSSAQPEVEELDVNDEMMLSVTDVDPEDATPSEEELKKAKKKKALKSAGKGALMGAKFGPWGALAGGVIGGAVGWFAKKGIKIKKKFYNHGGVHPKEKKKFVPATDAEIEAAGKKGLAYMPGQSKAKQERVWVKKRVYNHGGLHPEESDLNSRGGLFEALKNFNERRIDKRGKRRISRTEIYNKPNTEHLKELSYMADNPNQRRTMGYFNPNIWKAWGIPGRSVAMSPDAESDVLTHELIHSTQVGPLQRLARTMGFENAGTIQDKDTRKSFRKLQRSIRKNDSTLNQSGEYMAGNKSQDIEFEAIIKSAISSAKKRGYDFSGKNYDVLNQAREDGNMSVNMKHLGGFMGGNELNKGKEGNKWTEKQKGYILDSIKSNLDFEGYNTEDSKGDFR